MAMHKVLSTAARVEELKEKALSNSKSPYGLTLRMLRKSTGPNYWAILMVQVREIQNTMKTADGRDILALTDDIRRLIKGVKDWGATVPASRKNQLIKEMNQLSDDVLNWVQTSPRNNRYHFTWMYHLCGILDNAVLLMQNISVESEDSAPGDVQSGNSDPANDQETQKCAVKPEHQVPYEDQDQDCNILISFFSR